MFEDTTGTVVIGGGQAGLSLSHHLARRRQRHVVLERGRVGERWRSERWDSLTLLTPNWLNRIDGGSPHEAPEGFLSRAGFARYLNDHPRRPHVHEHVEVVGVEPWRGGFVVATDAAIWRARTVVLATGDCAIPRIPPAAAAAPGWIQHVHSSRYRNPAQLAPGGVLVVGAGSSGQQIAGELQRAGRDVVLAVGRHGRAVRRYRGRDIWHWLDRLGDLEVSIDHVPDPDAARQTPALPLSGANGGEQLDLDVLRRLGVTIAGRFQGFRSAGASFAGDLDANVADAEQRLHRLLDRIDDHIEETLPDWPHDAQRPEPVRIEQQPGELDLGSRGITTVIWATGYRREYPWLHAAAVDDTGELVHRHGITEIPGLYALGLRFQRRRSSHFIGGVGADAAFLAARIAARRVVSARRRQPACLGRVATAWPRRAPLPARRPRPW
jgi:putative flavoprotein involved in K+ transport